MATLEKIRSKSAFLVIVIGAALLAFIVGDAITNSRNLFGNGSTVANMGGKKIDYHEYEAKVKELQDQYGQQQDAQMLQQLAIEMLANEALLKEAVKKMGIDVSGDMLSQFLFNGGQNYPEIQNIAQAMQQQGVAFNDLKEMHAKIFNPKQYGLTDAQMKPFQDAWVAVEQKAKGDISMQMYMMLFDGAFNANDLDKQVMFDQMSNQQEVKMAFMPYGNLDDKKYQASDAELKAAYDLHKNRYKIAQPTKRVSLIAVDVKPSESDVNASKELAAASRKALSDSVVSLPKDLKTAGVSLSSETKLLSQIPMNYRTSLQNAPKDSIIEVFNNIEGFALVKKGRVTNQLDSVQIRVVFAADEKLADRVLAAVEGGLAIDSINNTFSKDSVMVSPEAEWIARYANGRPAINFSDELMANMTGAENKLFKVSEEDMLTLTGAANGALLMEVTDRKAPKDVYAYDIVEYTLLPSAGTLADKRNQLQKYINENNTAELFKKNADKNAYVVKEYNVTASTPAFPLNSNADVYNYPSAAAYGPLYENTSSLVGWVMKKGKAGKVRENVYENNVNTAPVIFAVAVDSEFEDYMPLDAVKDQLKAEVAKQKAGDELVKKYSASKSVDSAAQAMGATASTRKVNAQSMPGEGKVAGVIAGSKAGSPMKVVAGENGVYAFQVVKGEKTPAMKFDGNMVGNQYRQMMAPDGMQMLIIKSLRGNKKMNNHLFDFIAVD